MDFEIVRAKVKSPNMEHVAVVADYSLSAIAPSGQKVYVENIDGAEKEDIVLAYGYDNTVKWINDSTLEIIIEKGYNRNVYDIQIMKDHYKDIKIIYKKTIFENFGPNEKWDP